VLFVSSADSAGDLPACSSVRLVDFGGATWRDEPTEGSVVCTRQYRPPEVTLGVGWGHAVDLWSMGCILTELWTGELLFQTHDEVEHLALMERLLGALPPHMLRAAASASHRMERNVRHGALRWPERAFDRRSETHVRSQRRLRDVLLGAASPGGSPGAERLCAPALAKRRTERQHGRAKLGARRAAHRACRCSHGRSHSPTPGFCALQTTVELLGALPPVRSDPAPTRVRPHAAHQCRRRRPSPVCRFGRGAAPATAAASGAAAAASSAAFADGS